jgi:hypothetical protein
MHQHIILTKFSGLIVIVIDYTLIIVFSEIRDCLKLNQLKNHFNNYNLVWEKNT